MAPHRCCRLCGNEELERSEHKGELLCCRCGAVLEESAIVEGLQFAESPGGGMMMVGRFVPSGGTGRGLVFGGGESREQALHRGLSNIQSVADRLRLSPQHVSSAHRLYLMASQRSFNVGRKGVVVASACLYAICRRERTPHLLIDFSDVLRVSVRSLGQVFMKLLRVLHVQVPQVDPSLYLDRFAAQMPLGDQTRAVAQTAVRLVQAMARDWLSTGRRPMGLCGAALLVAARYHGIQIDAEDVAQVVRISAPTLSKRLLEFRSTATARLPAAELEKTDLLQLPAMELPPCRLKRMRRQRQITDGPSPHPESGDERGPSGEAPSEGRGGQYPKDSLVDLPEAAGSNRRLELGVASDKLCNEAPSSLDIITLAGKMVLAIGDSNLVCETAQLDAVVDSEKSSETACGVGEASQSSVCSDPLAELLRSVRERAENLLPLTDQVQPHLAGMASGYAKPSSSPNAGEEAQSADALEEDEEDSDEELDAMLLSPQERKAKSLIWDDLTRDIMPEVYRRLRQRRQREREQQLNPSQRRRPQRRQRAALDAAPTAAESVRLSLQRSAKGLAQRIDKEALESLFAAKSTVER